MNTISIKKLLEKGSVSPTLKSAIEESLKAIQTKNYNLAYQITACKSFIVDKINPKNKEFKNYAFQENRKINESLLKISAYEILDDLHFQLAMKIDALPSGMTVISSTPSGVTMNQMTPKGQHPIIKRIQYEKKLTQKKWEK